MLRVAVVNHEMSPYRVNKLLRLATEIPVQLRTFLMYSVGTSPWRIQAPPLLNQVDLGENSDLRRNSTITRCALMAGPQYRKGKRLVRELAEFKPDVIVQFGYSDVAYLMAMDWAWQRQIPVMLWADSNILGDRATGMKRALKRILLPMIVRRCSAVLTCGSLGSQYYQRYGARLDRIFYVPNEPDYRLIEEVSESAVQSVRDEYGLSEMRHRLVFSGRLVSLKRVDMLIEAFGRIAVRRPQWDLLVVGSGPLESELRDMVAPELRNRVVWTGFVDDQAKMSALYRTADVLVLPSNYEAWALVVNEAACAGLALVCSDVVGAAAELLENGQNGRVFASGDLAGLMAALLDVTQEDKLRKYQVRSLQLLAKWRREADPVDGFRAAIKRCGIET